MNSECQKGSIFTISDLHALAPVGGTKSFTSPKATACYTDIERYGPRMSVVRLEVSPASDLAVSFQRQKEEQHN
jgi:hypothetical protein